VKSVADFTTREKFAETPVLLCSNDTLRGAAPDASRRVAVDVSCDTIHSARGNDRVTDDEPGQTVRRAGMCEHRQQLDVPGLDSLSGRHPLLCTADDNQAAVDGESDVPAVSSVRGEAATGHEGHVCELDTSSAVRPDRTALTESALIAGK